jgi:phosphatidylserine/phosphatidylglycerophosphate/cardiolipin synthase-like enzyme
MMDSARLPNIAEQEQEKTEYSVNTSPTSLDRAAVYLHNHDQLSDEGSVNVRAVLRKIDWRVIPLSLMCMAVLFIDKLNISVCVLALLKKSLNLKYCFQYAAVMGMNQDLRLSGNEFSNTATASSVATLIAEVPMGTQLLLSYPYWPLPTRSKALLFNRFHQVNCLG